MTKLHSAALLSLVLLAGSPSLAQAQTARARVYAPGLTCAAVRAAVDSAGDVILASSPNAYDRVYRDAGACRDEVTGVPAFAPTTDDPACFAGYRCRQRNNGDAGR